MAVITTTCAVLCETIPRHSLHEMLWRRSYYSHEDDASWCFAQGHPTSWWSCRHWSSLKPVGSPGGGELVSLPAGSVGVFTTSLQCVHYLAAQGDTGLRGCEALSLHVSGRQVPRGMLPAGSGGRELPAAGGNQRIGGFTH